MEHKNASINKRHAPTNWRVLNIAELSTITVGADDVEKTAYIVDDGTGEPTTYVLTNYDPPTWKPSVSGTGGIATNLNGLSDVQIDTPTDKQTLTYNAIAARWENQSVTGVTPPAVGVVGADTSTGDSINMQNITDLTFALEANSVYELRAHLTFQSSSATGYAFGFTAPADSRPSCLPFSSFNKQISVNADSDIINSCTRHLCSPLFAAVKPWQA